MNRDEGTRRESERKEDASLKATECYIRWKARMTVDHNTFLEIVEKLTNHGKQICTDESAFLSYPIDICGSDN